MKILFIGTFYKTSFGEIPTEVFLSNALERADCDVKRLEVSITSQFIQKIKEKIKEVDIVFCSSKIIRTNTEIFSIFVDITKPKILYTNDWVFLDKTREQNYREKIKYIDYIISTDTTDYTKNFGIKKYWHIPMACLPSFGFNPSPQKDLIFTGYIGYSQDRKIFIEEIKKSFDLIIYGVGNKQPIYNKELEKTLQNYKIALGHNCVNSPGYWSSRLYITIGFGGFFITPYIKLLEREFKNKKHLVWYKNLKEGKKLIRYYLEHNKEREKIRRQGYEYCQKNYNWDVRAKEFIKVFKEIA